MMQARSPPRKNELDPLGHALPMLSNLSCAKSRFLTWHPALLLAKDRILPCWLDACDLNAYCAKVLYVLPCDAGIWLPSGDGSRAAHAHGRLLGRCWRGLGGRTQTPPHPQMHTLQMRPPQQSPVLSLDSTGRSTDVSRCLVRCWPAGGGPGSERRACRSAASGENTCMRRRPHPHMSLTVNNLTP